MSSDEKPRGLDEALREGILRTISNGQYLVEYSDATHSEGAWSELLDVEVHATAVSVFADESYPYYTVRPAAPLRAPAAKLLATPARRESAPAAVAAAGQAPRDRGRAEQTEKKEEERRAKERFRLRDALAQCLLRTGILPAAADPEGARDLLELARREALVLIPDTNALGNGTMHHLLRTFSRTQLWILPVVVSLTQIQEHDRRLKSALAEPKGANLANVLRSRTVVNGSLGLLARCRDRAQVLEVDPKLLRYLRPGGKGSADPDEGDILEDRLLVETIHTVFRTARTSAARRVVTSDVLLARMLHIEGIPALVQQVPPLPDAGAPCVRYDAGARTFVGAPLVQLLWDMAHIFSSVRLVEERSRSLVARFDTYWPGKTRADWVREALLVTVPDAPQVGTATFSAAVLPDVSLLPVLSLGGAILVGAAPLPALRERLADPPSVDTARMAGEVLLRAKLAVSDGASLATTAELGALDAALREERLDDASRIFRAYPPYAALLDALSARQTVTIPELPDLLAVATHGQPSRKACERLARMPAYLGQAWTAESALLDGTRRPSDDAIATRLRELFDANARDGLCTIDVLLTALCKEQRMTPWAAAGAVRRLVEAGQLPSLAFDPALGPGRRARSRDSIVKGSLLHISEAPVPMDRLEIRSRPVFTVSKRSP